MGMLDGVDLSQSPGLYGLLNLPASAGFPDVAPPVSEADEAQKAREAAARVLGRRGESRQDWGAKGNTLPGVDQTNPAVQMALGNMPAPVPNASAGPTIAPQPTQPAPMAAGSPAPALPAPQTIAPPPAVAAPPVPQTDEAALPPNATPTEGKGLPTPDVPQTSLLGRLGGKLNENSNLLLSMAGGFGGAQSFGQGMGRAFQAAVPGSQLDRHVQNQNLTVQALVKRGMPLDAARAAATNPAILQQLIPQVFGAKQVEFKTIKDSLGGEVPIIWNAATGKATTLDGKPYEGGGSAGGGTMLASGVEKYDPTLTGQAYLDQFNPDMKAAIKGWLSGDQMPTGNPRMQSIWNQAKVFAGNYANQMGLPFSDTLYAEKRKYRTELGSTSPSTAGGQAKAFNQGTGHLADLADRMEKLDNSNGLGIPVIARGVNSIRQGFSTEQAAIADEASSLGQTVAGEVGKLFSGSAGGGVHERELTRDRFDSVKSKPQLAAALRATLVTMHDGLAALEQRRDQVLGPDNKVEFVADETKKNIAKIQGIIDRLEGKSSAKDHSESASALPPGWSVKVH